MSDNSLKHFMVKKKKLISRKLSIILDWKEKIVTMQNIKILTPPFLKIALLNFEI